MDMKNCTACPRMCRADREKSAGFCRMPDKFVVARSALHMWEEPCISGKNGSGTVFFSGCSLKCVYCQNYKLSHEAYGAQVTEKALVKMFHNLIEQGAHNINLVNPTHYAPMLAKVLKENPLPVPVVYNSSGYERVETLRELEGLIDVYLPDLKYIDADKSEKYSNAKDYFKYASRAIPEMYRQVGKASFDEKGIIRKGLIIRHLILPANIHQSYKILDWIKENLPSDTFVSLMCQYTPFGNLSGHPEIDRKITRREYNKVVSYMEEIGLVNGYIQEHSSAGRQYIPDFALQGVITDNHGGEI